MGRVGPLGFGLLVSNGVCPLHISEFSSVLIGTEFDFC